MDRLQQLLVGVEADAEPAVQGALADLEDQQEDHRQADQQRQGRQAGRQEEVVEERVHQVGQQQAGEKDDRALGVETIADRLGDDGEDRGGAAVHHRGAEAADRPHRQVGIGQDHEVVGVLDRGEACADGEAADRRVHQKAEPPPEQRHGDDAALDHLLDQRRQIADEHGQAEPGGGLDARVQQQADQRRQAAQADDQEHAAQTHQLVAVEQHQG